MSASPDRSNDTHLVHHDLHTRVLIYIPDITFAGQLDAPPSLTVWMQCMERAGRDAHLQAHAVLFIEASTLKAVMRKDEGDSESQRDEEALETKTYHKKYTLPIRYVIWSLFPHALSSLLYQSWHLFVSVTSALITELLTWTSPLIQKKRHLPSLTHRL